MNGSPDSQPIAEAVRWVGVLTTIAMEMVLPAGLGQWLDRRWGTQWLFLVGVGLGLSVGLWHLVQLTKDQSRSGRGPDSGRNE